MFILLPYKNNRQISLFPAVTYALIAANVCLYFVLLPIHRYTLVHMMGFIPQNLSVTHILSSMFVHADFWHLIWNMLFLWLFGPNVEDALGHIEFTLLYLGSGIAAALLQVAIVQGFIPGAGIIPVVGASGAIAGILGVFAVRFFKTGIRVFYYVGILFYPLRWGTFTVPAIAGIGVWFIQQLIGGVMDVANQGQAGIAYWSHIGGMIFGMMLAYGLSMSVVASKEYLLDDVQTSMERGTADNAVSKLSKALKTDPDNPDIYTELARVYSAGNNLEASVSNYEKSIDLYFSKGNRDMAIACYAELKHHFQDARLNPRLEYRIARHLQETGCCELAVKMFNEISAKYPESPEAELSLMKAGDICLNTLNDPLKAADFYECFCKNFPHSELCPIVEKLLKNAKQQL